MLCFAFAVPQLTPAALTTIPVVVMSLFVGVITMGMCDFIESMQNKHAAEDYKKKLLKLQHDIFSLEKSELCVLIDHAMERPMEVASLMKRWKARSAKRITRRRGCGLLGRFQDCAALCRRVEAHSAFHATIFVVIFVGAVSIGLAADRVGSKEGLHYLDLACLVLFQLEMLVKVVAKEHRPLKYFDDYWNRFDFVIVVNGWLYFAGGWVSGWVWMWVGGARCSLS